MLCVVGICANTWAVLKMASLVYFFKYHLGDEAGCGSCSPMRWAHDLSQTHIPALLKTLRFLFTGVGGFMFWGTSSTSWASWPPAGSPRCSANALYIVATIGNIVTTAAYFFAGPNDMVFLYVMNILGGFSSGPVSPLIWAIFADTADYSEWKTGRRATGLIFSAGTFAQKMGWTIGGTLAGLLLGFYGFQANVVQSTGSLLGIRLLVSLIPAVAAVLAAIVMYFYQIDEKKLKQITSDLAERRAREATTPAQA